MNIIGLGNPGNKYNLNRHNIGFHFVDWLIKKLNPEGQWHQESHGKYLYTKYTIQSDSYFFCKPNTFMNLSGKAVSSFIGYFKQVSTGNKNIVIAHDDLDMPVGLWKLDFAKGPKLHNGIASIEETLGTNQFWRLRIGVDNRDTLHRTPGLAYVLQDFTDEELQNIILQFPAMWRRILESVDH